MDERDESVRVYGPSDWRELTGAPIPRLPGGSISCAAIKDDGQVCGNRAVAGTPLCRSHGGTTVSVQEQARRRIDMVRSELFEMLCGAAKEAAETYVTVMRTGKQDRDRLRAADRVLELLGFNDDVANVSHDGPENEIDKQLKVLLINVTQEKLAQAIEATGEEIVRVADDGNTDAA